MTRSAIGEAYSRYQSKRLEAYEAAKQRGEPERWLTEFAAEIQAPAPVRLAKFLLFALKGRQIDGVSQLELSKLLGITRPYLSLTLNRWAREGLIRMQWRELELLDRKALEAIARGG